MSSPDDDFVRSIADIARTRPAAGPESLDPTQVAPAASTEPTTGALASSRASDVAICDALTTGELNVDSASESIAAQELARLIGVDRANWTDEIRAEIALLIADDPLLTELLAELRNRPAD